MAKTTTNQETVEGNQEDNKSLPNADQSSAIETEAAAKAAAEAEASRLAEEEVAEAKSEAEAAKQLDMSLAARKARAQVALDESLEARERINAIVSERTKELDDLIIEEGSLVDKNPMSEIQFYLTHQQRKREEKAERKNAMLERGLDPDGLIKALEIRAPIDQKGGSGRKPDPRSIRQPAAK